MSDFWIDESKITQWDTLYLGGVVWPGVCQISPKQDRAVSVAKKRGREPTLTDDGYNPGEITATLLIWTPDQWDQLKSILPRFSPRKNETIRTPLEISHPVTSLLGIDAVIIRSISPRHPEGGIFRVDISMLQWFPETRRRTSIGRSDGGPLTESDFSVQLPDAGINL